MRTDEADKSLGLALTCRCTAIAWLAVVSTLLGCNPESGVNQESPGTTGQEHHASSEHKLVRIAKDHLQQHRPEWANVDHLQAQIIEHPDYWEVAWELPPDILGGTPVLHLDKDTQEVIEVYHTQ